ncbi:YfhO family protein [Ruminococcus albus]|uniref:Membrane protein YfhO n=1 Tax=Ruminococcus albus (strain ATCC 27210 / DSM 20455 / JCM 14654 / NCDO 2250 / 7) TaxID=697329 RepID=E6UFA1_RUMA7|nr:YfhO family protein [Ruminococcus albus]ADU20987.1 Protein of unknown function, membrane YfhO [Ruminococcus albus 7 = DSM 20455]
MPDEKNMIKHPLLKLFFTSFFLFLVGISPILIISKGVYMWTGDYNEQTIVFTEYISKLLHSGQGFPAFDWNSFLGMDFLTSYHDHIFSPFDWLMYAVPTGVMPYIHTVVMALKVGLSAVTAYIYCRQYVKKDQSAYLCGLLYAFSGFQLFDLVYQFSERYLMFPLMLYCFDQLVINRKPFCFAALLGIYCLISPVFAWMTCLFLLIYYIVRTATKSFPKLDLKLFMRLAIETGCGVLMSAMLMLPFYSVLSGNARADGKIFSHSLIAYENPGVVLCIIRSMFFPPALCANDWYFRNSQLSISPPLLYIPLFLILGVYMIFKKEKRAWYSVLLKVCIIFACVPVLNSSFAVFNNRYYARWLFMPLLVMIMMTGRYIDNIEDAKPKKELRICAAIVGFMIVYGVYTACFEKPRIYGNRAWIIMAAVSLFGMIVLYLLHYPMDKVSFISVRNIRKLVCVCCVLPFFGTAFFLAQENYFESIPKQKDIMWNGSEPVVIDDDEFFRTSYCMTNTKNKSMIWGYPTIATFNSMITGDTSSFLGETGNNFNKKINLTFDTDNYALCSFLSVKYDLYCNLLLTGGIEVEPEDLNKHIEGFEQDKVINRYVLYKNKAFIPMGFTYDNYIRIDAQPHNSDEDSRKMYDDKVDRQKLFLKAIWLTDEQIEKYGDILQELPEDKYNDVSVETYYQDCRDRAASACYEFVPDKTGFNARIDLPKDNLVFFSVPYNRYFTAYIDGSPTEIERVFNGLSAVYVPQGDHSISFRYRIPGFKYGVIISSVSAGILLIYTAVDLILKRRIRSKDGTAVNEA